MFRDPCLDVVLCKCIIVLKVDKMCEIIDFRHYKYRARPLLISYVIQLTLILVSPKFVIRFYAACL